MAKSLRQILAASREPRARPQKFSAPSFVKCGAGRRQAGRPSGARRPSGLTPKHTLTQSYTHSLGSAHGPGLPPARYHRPHAGPPAASHVSGASVTLVSVASAEPCGTLPLGTAGQGMVPRGPATHFVRRTHAPGRPLETGGGCGRSLDAENVATSSNTRPYRLGQISRHYVFKPPPPPPPHTCK